MPSAVPSVSQAHPASMTVEAVESIATIWPNDSGASEQTVKPGPRASIISNARVTPSASPSPSPTPSPASQPPVEEARPSVGAVSHKSGVEWLKALEPEQAAALGVDVEALGRLSAAVSVDDKLDDAEVDMSSEIDAKSVDSNVVNDIRNKICSPVPGVRMEVEGESIVRKSISQREREIQQAAAARS